MCISVQLSTAACICTAIFNLQAVIFQAHGHGSTPSTRVRKRLSTPSKPSTSARKHVSIESTRACKHVKHAI